MRWALLVPILAACGSNDIVGPYTGASHRFVVENFTLPQTRNDAFVVADDLDGDGMRDNVLGQVIALLSFQHDVTSYGAAMVASGTIASSVIIQADDLTTDPHVGVSYFGTDDAVANAMGGAFVAGNLSSNRTAWSTALGAGTIVLPVFVDADPTTLELAYSEIDLATDGMGGFDAQIRGLVDPDRAKQVAAAGLTQMMMANPQDHVDAAQFFFDANHDGHVTEAEVLASDTLTEMLSPDITHEGQRWLSVAFTAHLRPCDAGRCPVSGVVDRCHDRLRNGDETDVDCGGTACGACGEHGACVTGSDCSTQACDAGTCRDWTCHDGLRDGFEPAVDCGGAGCASCAGTACGLPANCASGTCVNGLCQ